MRPGQTPLHAILTQCHESVGLAHHEIEHRLQGKTGFCNGSAPECYHPAGSGTSAPMVRKTPHSECAQPYTHAPLPPAHEQICNRKKRAGGCCSGATESGPAFARHSCARGPSASAASGLRGRMLPARPRFERLAITQAFGTAPERHGPKRFATGKRRPWPNSRNPPPGNFAKARGPFSKTGLRFTCPPML